jgi:hypothetical protein
MFLSLLLLDLSWLCAQTAPPTLQTVKPTGAQRGTQITLEIEGTNIDGATGLIFSEPGFSTEIAGIKELPMVKRKAPKGVVVTSAPIEDKARKFRVTVRVKIDPDVPVGVHFFRVRTALGVSNLLPFGTGSFTEINETEPASSSPQKISFPATIVGTLDEPGDVDSFQFQARPGEELVFQTLARPLNSQADTVLRLKDSQGRVLAENNDVDTNRDALLAYKFSNSGTYTLEIEDVEHGGGKNFFYRIYAGAFPYLAQVFPLGLQKKTSAEISVQGFNLGKIEKIKVIGEGLTPPAKTVPVSLHTPGGPTLNRARLALGDYVEVFENEPNDRPATAQPLAIPSTVNGRIQSVTSGTSPGGDHSADRDLYRIHARKGQELVFEVTAQQLGSPLDSILEILDANGAPVPRATLRCVAQTNLALNDPDSARKGIRLASWNDLAINDYVMIGEEILQVDEMPTHPDADMVFKGFRGSRIGMLDTTPRNHAVGTPVYKVEVHPAGTKFPPNGMPLFQINYENDDGGVMFGGKDSLLHFIAPEKGDYLVRLRDVRNLEGDRYAYRLTVREPAPDYEVTFDPKSFNIPRGGRVSLTVTALRKDGFQGPIQVELQDLPRGLTATRGTIPEGEDTTTLVLTAAEDINLNNYSASIKSMYLSAPGPGARRPGTPRASMELPGLVNLKLAARAVIDGKEVIHDAQVGEPISVVALAPAPDLMVKALTPALELTPGASVSVTVTIQRNNGFTGRVPISVMNLPHGVRVNDIGLNAILITEQETSRTFHIVAEPWVQPMKLPLVITGRVEVNSPLRDEAAAEPVELVIKPGKQTAAK